MDPLDDIRFWSHQLSEHALFFSLGLEVEPYKAQAAALHSDWEKARAALEGVSDLVAAREIASAPTKNLSDWQIGVAAELQNKWLGWLPPLFWDHTLRELRYFVARAWYNGWEPGTTLLANLQFMREHAEFAAHLLDPTQHDLITQAKNAAQSFASIERNCCAALTPAILDLSAKAGQALDAYLTDNPVSSPARGVIHPVLADHVVREGKRFLETLNQLR